MSPFSPQVVAAACLMSSPVFYQVLVARTAALDFALTRFLIIWVITWIVVSLVVDLMFPSRLETERRVRDIELAAREVRKALEEAEAEAARAEAEAAADGHEGLAFLEAMAGAGQPEGARDDADAPSVPVQRSEGAARQDQAAEGSSGATPA